MLLEDNFSAVHQNLLPPQVYETWHCFERKPSAHLQSPTLRLIPLHLFRERKRIMRIIHSPILMAYQQGCENLQNWWHSVKRSPITQPSSPLYLRCTISDNGIGMTQQQSDRLFDLYSRGPNKRQSLSLGLGLYMCRQIITAHGVRLE